MKVPKGLLAAVIVLAALSGGVYWSNKHKAEEDKKPLPDAAPKILTIPEDQIKEIKLAKKDQDAAGPLARFRHVADHCSQAHGRRSGRRTPLGQPLFPA